MVKRSGEAQTSIEYLLLIGASVIFTIIVTLAAGELVSDTGLKLPILGGQIVTAVATFSAMTPTPLIIPSASVQIPGCVMGTPCTDMQYCSGAFASCRQRLEYDSLCNCVPVGGEICTPCGIINGGTNDTFACPAGSVMETCEKTCQRTCSAPDGTCVDCEPICTGRCVPLPPSCTIESDANFMEGPFNAELTAVFTNLEAGITKARLKCKGGDPETEVDIVGNTATLSCAYAAVAEVTIHEISASASGVPPVACTNSVAVAPPGPSCIVYANPDDAPGPFDSTIIAELSNIPAGVTSSLLRCNSSDPGISVPLAGNSASRACPYPRVYGAESFDISATNGAATCQNTVIARSLEPGCLITPDPDAGEGIFSSELVVDFVDLEPGVSEALVRCSGTDPGTLAPIVGNIASRTCNYGPVPEDTTYEVDATAGNASCTAEVRASSLPPSCEISAEPPSGIGPYASTLTAAFSNLEPGVTVALLKCRETDAGMNVNIVGNIAQRNCAYNAVAAPAKIYTISATAGSAACTNTTIDYPPSPACALTADPESDIGPFWSDLRAQFSNLPAGVGQALMKCNSTDPGTNKAISPLGVATRSCQYPLIAASTTFLANAAADAAFCSVEVTDLPAPSCTILGAPNTGFGPYTSTLTATFSNLGAGVISANLRCSFTGPLDAVPIIGNVATYTCNYPAVANPVTNQIGAVAGAASCTNLTYVDPDPSCISACGILIDEPGSYRLCNDISTSSTTTPCIRIETHDAQLDCENHRITGPMVDLGTAIRVFQSQSILIENCRISNIGVALNITGSGFPPVGTTFRSNFVENSDRINIYRSGSNLITQNTLRLAKGVYAYSLGAASNSRNTFTDNFITITMAGGRGIQLTGEKYDIVDGNDLTGIGNNIRFIMLDSSSYNNVTDNLVHDWNEGTGLYLKSSNNNNALNNRFLNGITRDSRIIHLDNSDDNVVENNNIVSKADLLVELSSSERNKLLTNSIQFAGVAGASDGGIGLRASDQNEIRGNTVIGISAPGSSGITLQEADSNTFTVNTIQNWMRGILVVDGGAFGSSSENVVTQNAVSGTTYGVEVQVSNPYNTITNNNLAATNCAVYLCGSNDNGCQACPASPIDAGTCLDMVVTGNTPNKCRVP